MITALQGMHGWLLQRLTAVFMLFYLILAVAYFLLTPPQSYEDWHSAMSATPVAVLTALFFITLLLHAWIGLRDIAIDYVHRLSLRLVILSVIAALLFGQTLWLMLILIKTKL